MLKNFDIVGSYDNQRVSTFSAERTVNLFEYIDPEGKKPKALFPTAGLVNTNISFSPETNGSRATFVFGDSIFQVFGSSVYRITGNTGALIASEIGTLSNVVGYVGVDANSFQVIFVDGQHGYIWDTNAETFEQITDTGFPTKPIDVCYLDGFFIVANGDTNNFQLSSLNQGMVWSGGSATYTADSSTDILTLSTSNANFATGVPVTLSNVGGSLPTSSAPTLTTSDTYYIIRIGSASTNPGTVKLARTYDDAINNVPIDILTNGTPVNTITVVGELQQGSITTHPGTIVGCRTLHRRLFLFSQNFTEVWENAGIGTNLPFRRNNSLLMEIGTPSVGSISAGFDRMFFLSQDRDGLGSVVEVQGTQANVASNRALDYQLAQYAADPDIGVADARGILIKENGLIFYRLNFTAANHTFVLNVSMSSPETPRWHEEEVLNGDRHLGQTHAFFKGVNYYGSYSDATFYYIDDQISTNDGEAIRRMRIGKQVTPEGYNRTRIDRFHLDLLQGRVEFITSGNQVDILTDDSDTLITDSGIDLVISDSISTQGDAPSIFLQVSKDGGQSYGYRLLAPMGQIGERTFRTVWRKIGTIPRGQGFTPKIEFFYKVPLVILGAAWDFEVLPE